MRPEGAADLAISSGYENDGISSHRRGGALRSRSDRIGFGFSH
jgi:hypothetical protein